MSSQKYVARRAEGMRGISSFMLLICEDERSKNAYADEGQMRNIFFSGQTLRLVCEIKHCRTWDAPIWYL
jgi:hypothetical protein